MHEHHYHGRDYDFPGLDNFGPEFQMAELFPNEGLTLIFAGFPKGGGGPANTWLGLFTANSGSALGSVSSVSTIASWGEVASAGAYARQTISSASWGTAATTQSGWGTAAAQVTFATATAVWGTVNGFFIGSSATQGAGSVYFGCNFDDTTPVAVNTNDVIKITPTWVYTG
jgi:hypothetical protein